MSLTSSLYSGISGLSATGNALQVIGDNIANSTTTGFKSSSYSFQDLLTQTIATQSGTAQVGRGTALGEISSDFSTGSLESTGNTTDLAIGGDGFFVVEDSSSNSLYYTRAGEFSFDNDGYLTNPEGYIVQGWKLDDSGDAVGAVTDILLESLTSPPQESDQVTLIANLDSDAENLSTLTDVWDATESPPISDLNYEYQTSITVYDSLGSTHDLSVYFDKTDTASEWEYIITCDPSEDSRAGFDATIYQGLLASGTITFSDSSGSILGMTLSTLDDATPAWTAATTDSNGYLQFQCDFIGGTDTEMDIEFNIGSRWDGTTWANDASSTTQYATSSTTTFQSATGYGAGDLQGVDVDTDGVITGTYSNGALVPLYQVALADFQNPNGLTKVGGNLYQETNDSGDAITNYAGTSGLGSISPSSLEQSNVDIATEFVRMIEIQRAYQANSKIITTVDSMLSDTISMKR
ncbi:MAG: flagellar hook protein FlgE [Pseudomonadota bacterium]